MDNLRDYYLKELGITQWRLRAASCAQLSDFLIISSETELTPSIQTMLSKMLQALNWPADTPIRFLNTLEPEAFLKKHFWDFVHQLSTKNIMLFDINLSNLIGLSQESKHIILPDDKDELNIVALPRLDQLSNNPSLKRSAWLMMQALIKA